MIDARIRLGGVKTLISLFLILVAQNSFAYRYNVDQFEQAKWVSPVSGEIVTDSFFDYLSPTYLQNHGVHHVGLDIVASYGSPIYAIADGEVYYVRRDTSSAFNNSRVYVRHRLRGGSDFTAVYAHCYPRSEISEGDFVVAGQALCNIRSYGSPDHLHFGINTNPNIGSIGYGVMASWQSATSLGWVDPATFLQQNRPMSHVFHGTGSLISQSTGSTVCFGCNKDELRVHPISGKKPLVAFQWQLSERCQSIEFSATSLSGQVRYPEVNIRWGTWANRAKDTVYSNAYLPFVINAGSSAEGLRASYGLYRTVLMRFDEEINESMAVRAVCRSSGSSTKRPATMKSAVDYSGISFDTGQWNGNGSIISSSTGTTSCFGCDKDDARVHNTEFNITPEVYFQWQASPRCRALNLKVGAGDGGNFSEYHRVEFFVKPWNVNCSAEPGRCNFFVATLPYKLQGAYAPSNGNYSVMRLRFMNDVSSQRTIRAECAVQ